MSPIWWDGTLDLEAMYTRLTEARRFRSDFGSCYLSADVWAYELGQMTKNPVEKAVLLFTKDQIGIWSYHVAPVVNEAGIYYVFEKANGIKTVLDIYEWNRRMGERGCAISYKLPERFKAGFVLHQNDDFESPQYRYDPDKVSGGCVLLIADRHFSTPGEGLLGYPAHPWGYKPKPLNLERAIESCRKKRPKRLKKFCETELKSF